MLLKVFTIRWDNLRAITMAVSTDLIILIMATAIMRSLSTHTYCKGNIHALWPKGIILKDNIWAMYNIFKE